MPLIFESPDKGKTVYARNFGTIEKMRIDSNGNVGIGTSDLEQLPINLHDQLMEDKLWGNIRRAAKTDSTLQEALERVKVTYYLTKDYEERYGNRKT
jgi:hypothetical protein